MDKQPLSLRAIRFYQRRISPLFPPRCRFYPTCSEYTFQAIERYGFFLGAALGAFRILRCNPLCRGGVDPVPEFKRIKYKHHRSAEPDREEAPRTEDNEE